MAQGSMRVAGTKGAQGVKSLFCWCQGLPRTVQSCSLASSAGGVVCTSVVCTCACARARAREHIIIMHTCGLWECLLFNKIKGFFEHRQTGDMSPADIMRSAGIRMFWAINSARNQHTGSHFKPLSLRISQVSKFRRAISKRMRFVHTWLHKRPCLQTLPRIKGGSPGYGQTQGLDHTVILHKMRVIAPTFSKMSIPQIDKECDYSHLVRAVEYSIVPNSNTALCHLPSLIPRITPKTRSLKFSNCEHTAELHNLFCV